MSTVDERVVQMKFNHDDFKNKATETLSILDKLKQKLHLDGASKGLQDVGAAAHKVDFQPMHQGLDGLIGKFSALQVAGVTALATIVHQATSAGLNMAKSLSLGTISDGFNDYNAKLTSVQTIMNATGASIGVVDAYFKELDTYADKTVYNLRDMTGAFAKFTNAGVDMKQSVPAIKGIANMTALAGQGAEAASIAMYNLSQSIAGGFLTTTDYKSLNLANVATKEWKNNLIQAAVNAGTLKKTSNGLYQIPGAKTAVTDAQLFNEELSKGWANSEVLLKVLGDYGDTTTAIGKKAQAAAQNVKSLPMMFDTIKASLGTQWTDTFELVFGNVEEATKLFTSLTNTLSGVLGASGEARNALLRDWKKMHGREILIYAVKNAWMSLVSIMKPIREAFREVFPRKTGEDLVHFTILLRKLAKQFIVGEERAEQIKSVFKGIFSVFKIGFAIVGGIVRLFGSLFGVVNKGSGGIFAAAAAAGDFLAAIASWVTESGSITKFFDGLIAARTHVLIPMVEFASKLGEAFVKLFTGDYSGFADGLKSAFGSTGDILVAIQESIFGMVKKFEAFFGIGIQGIRDFASTLGGAGQEILNNIADIAEAANNLFKGFKHGSAEAGSELSKLGVIGGGIKSVFEGVGKAFSSVGGGVGGIGSSISEFIRTVFDKITEGLKNMDFDEVVSLVNTGLLISLYMGFRKMLGSFNDLIRDIDKLVQNFTQIIDGVKDTLKSLQNSVRATMILKIAIAVGILAAAVLVLSRIPGDDLKKALTGLTVLFVQVGIVFAMLTKWNPASFTSAAGGLVLMAIAIKILAGSVQMLGEMDSRVLIQGGEALGIMLAALSGFLLVMNGLKGIPAAAAGLLILSVALASLVGTIKVFSMISWDTLGKGLTMMALTLTALGLALRAMPKNSIKSAVSLTILAAALVIMGGAIAFIGNLDLSTLAKGMITIALALALLVGAANGMVGALPGAAAMFVMASALGVLAITLKLLGGLDLWTITKGLLAMVAVFAVIGVSALLLTPVIPVIAALGAALFVLGKAMLLGSLAFGLFAVALTALAASGAAGFLVLITGIQGFLGLIPLFATQLGNGLVAFIVVIRESANKILDSIFDILTNLLEHIVKFIPKVMEAMAKMVLAMVRTVVKLAPQLYAAGLDLIIGFMQALNRRIYMITTIAISIVRNFMRAIRDNLPGIIQSGVDLILNFLHGLADAIRNNSDEIADAGIDIGKALATGIAKGIKKAGGEALNAAKDVATGALGKVASIWKSHSPSRAFQELGEFGGQGLAIGLTTHSKMVEKASGGLANTALDTMRNAFNKMTILDDMDTTPVIRPVLDLSDVKAGANSMGKMFANQKLSTSGSFNGANDASLGYLANKEAGLSEAAIAAVTGQAPVSFTQVNNSPKALSSAEIYRNTNNLLSVVKKRG